MTRAGTLLLAWTAVAGPAAAQRPPPPDLGAVAARLESEVGRVLEAASIPAISIALVQDGNVVWADAFGVANVATGEAATADTYFSTGSTLKPVTAAALMLLVEEGRLSLDTPFNEVAGDSLAIDGADDVTLRHLLAHHSGLEGPVDIVPLWSREHLRTPRETIEATRRVGPPGVEYRYCNECYAMVGHVIESLSGTTFDAWLAERIFSPLGADVPSVSVPPPGAVERLALPYGGEDGVAVPLPQIRTNVFAAGDAYLRARDMAAFLAMLLGGGEYRGTRILGEASVLEILGPQLDEDGEGLGINRSELDGRAVVAKNGIFDGYHSHMVGDPVTGDGAYVVANSSTAGPAVASLARLALRLLWGTAPPWAEETPPPGGDLAAVRDLP